MVMTNMAKKRMFDANRRLQNLSPDKKVYDGGDNDDRGGVRNDDDDDDIDYVDVDHDDQDDEEDGV